MDSKAIRIVVVSYFNVEEAKNAFNRLLEVKIGEERIQAAYVYNNGDQSSLSSIHESLDSSKSDRSEDGSSDSEKKKALVPPSSGNEELKSQTVVLKTKETVESTACNFDGDNVSEGYVLLFNSSTTHSIEINMPRNVVPKPFPTSYYHTPTGSVLHTESTTYMDSDEALSSSGRFDPSSSFYSPEHFAGHSRKSSGMSQAPFGSPYANSGTLDYSSNPQFLLTQPVRRLAAPVPMHTHTKSYDVAAGLPHPRPLQPPPPMYPAYNMCTSPYDSTTGMSYYASCVEPTTEYPWEEQLGYMDPYYLSSTMSYPPEASMPAGKKGGRKKNPESEASKAMYTINLDDILNKRDNRTTIMIKNIPNKYNQKMLLKRIDEVCKRQYDFFYLPIDFKVSYYTRRS